MKGLELYTCEKLRYWTKKTLETQKIKILRQTVVFRRGKCLVSFWVIGEGKRFVFIFRKWPGRSDKRILTGYYYLNKENTGRLKNGQGRLWIYQKRQNCGIRLWGGRSDRKILVTDNLCHLSFAHVFWKLDSSQLRPPRAKLNIESGSSKTLLVPVMSEK